MELIEKHIKLSTTMMITELKIVNTVDIYGHQDLEFVYGMNEKHTSIKRMFKEIKRILCRKKSQ